MALSDMAVRKAKSRQRPYKLADGGGLCLLVTPAGGRLWRFKYRMHGIERKLSLGCYPDRSLAEARERRDAARKVVALAREGGEYAPLEPVAAKRRAKAEARVALGHTFDALAGECIDKAKREVCLINREPAATRLPQDISASVNAWRNDADANFTPLFKCLPERRKRARGGTPALGSYRGGGKVRQKIAIGRDFRPHLSVSVRLDASTAVRGGTANREGRTMPKLIPIMDAARELSIGRSKTYELINQGLLLTIRIGRRRLVVASSVSDLIDEAARRDAA